MKFLLFFISLIIFSISFATAIEVNDEVPVELLIVAPQGRLYRAKRQFGGFGASAGQAGSQSFGFGPGGFNAAESLAASQSYNFGGHHLNVGFSESLSANQGGASGAFSPTFSYTR